MQMPPFFGKQIVDSSATEFVAFGTNQAARFIQREVNLALGAERFAVYSDVVVQRINLFAKFGDHITVNSDAPLGNDLLAGAPRGHARIGEKLLEANHGQKRTYGLRFTFYAISLSAKLNP